MASNDNSGEEISVDLSLLKDQSKIYRSEPVSKYQTAVNEAAYELCKKDGSLLLNKGKLFELSRKKVNEDGYVYDKKESRSKYYGGHPLQGQRESTQGKKSENLELMTSMSRSHH